MTKTVLITGASRGLGASIAEVFAMHQYHVLINYNQSEEQAKKLKEKLESAYKTKVTLLKADISKENEILSLIEKLEYENIKLDCLVNNAGISLDCLFEDKTIEDFQKIFQVNLIAPFLLSQKLGQKMYENKQGKIINITSTNGIDTYYPMSIDYDASKSALISLTHNLAVQFAPYINVNAIASGWMNTEMNKELDCEYKQNEENKILLKRFAEPQEIANAVYFLASDEASYINNAVIRADGGYYI